MAARLPLAAAFALSFVMALIMATILAVPVMAPAIAAETGLSTSLLGLYAFLMWSAAMVTSWSIGRVIRRVGPIGTVQAALTLCAVALAIGASGHAVALAFLPPIIGVACALETPASSEALGHVTPPARRTFIFSLKQTGVQIGGFAAGLAFPAALPVLGWRGAMLALAAALLAWAAALEILRRRLDRGWQPHPAAAGGASALARVWRTPALRDLAIVSFAFHAMQICQNTFLVAYLVAEHGHSLATAGFLLSLAQIGGFLGRVGCGFVVGPRLPVMRLLAAAGFGMTAAALLTALAAGALPPLALGALCFLFGLTAAGWNGVFFAEIARQAPPGEIGCITGGVMVAAYAGLILGPLGFSAAAAAAATLAAGFVLLSAATLAGTLLLGRTPAPAR